MERLLLLLRGAITAAARVGLMMNVPRKHLDAVLSCCPRSATPTISALADDRWVAINTVVEEKLVRELLPELVEPRRARASSSTPSTRSSAEPA